jgi:hypothetical protein
VFIKSNKCFGKTEIGSVVSIVISNTKGNEMKHVIAGILLLTIGAFFSPVVAEGNPVQFDVRLGNGALICDKQESVEATLNMPGMMPDCGAFRSKSGADVTVVVVGTATDSTGKEWPVVLFYFHNPTPWGNQYQFGYWAGEIPLPGEAA